MTFHLAVGSPLDSWRLLSLKVPQLRVLYCSLCTKTNSFILFYDCTYCTSCFPPCPQTPVCYVHKISTLNIKRWKRKGGGGSLTITTVTDFAWKLEMAEEKEGEGLRWDGGWGKGKGFKGGKGRKGVKCLQNEEEAVVADEAAIKIRSFPLVDCSRLEYERLIFSEVWIQNIYATQATHLRNM